MATINQRKEAYIHLADTNNIDLHDVELSWRTHKEADDAFATLNAHIEGAKKAEKTKEKDTMGKKKTTPKKEAPKAGTKAAIMAEYEALRTSDPELEEAYLPLPKAITLAAAKIELDKLKEDSNVEGTSSNTDNSSDPSGDEGAGDSGEDDEKVYVTEKQYAFLGMFTKKPSLIKKAQDTMDGEKEGSGKAVHIMVSGLEKKGLMVTAVNSKDQKTAALTTLGAAIKKAKFVAAPEKPKSTPRKKKPFVAPHSDEEIAGAKKKKRSKMIEANAAALIEYTEKKGGTRTPSTYNGKVKVGKWSKETVNEVNAAKDLWEEVVTKKFLITRKAFYELGASEYGMKPSTGASVWSKMYKHYDFTKDQVDALLVKSGLKTAGKASKKTEEKAPDAGMSPPEMTKEQKKAAKKAKKAAKKAAKGRA